MLSCPLCGTDAPREGNHCKCGYSFAAARAQGEPRTPSPVPVPPLATAPVSSAVSIFGQVVFWLGIYAMFHAAFLYDPSVNPSTLSGLSDAMGLADTEMRVANLGRLQNQMMFFQAGAAAMIAGAVLWSGGVVYKIIRMAAYATRG